MLCDDLEGWDTGCGGRETQEGRYVRIHIGDSRCSTAEINTTL